MQRLPAQAGDGGEGLQPAWDVARRVGVQGAATPLVTGVEGGQQVHHLGATNLADNEPVRAHPQCLPDQVA